MARTRRDFLRRSVDTIDGESFRRCPGHVNDCLVRHHPLDEQNKKGLAQSICGAVRACCKGQSKYILLIDSSRTTYSPYFFHLIHLPCPASVMTCQNLVTLLLLIFQLGAEAKVRILLPPIPLSFQRLVSPCASSGGFSSDPRPIQSVAAARSSALHRQQARYASPRSQTRQKIRTIQLC